MEQMIKGTGVALYGSALQNSDGSFVATQWVVIVFLPIFPLKSVRLLPQRDTTPWWKLSSGPFNQLLEVLPLHKPHVIFGYSITFSVLIALALLFAG